MAPLFPQPRTSTDVTLPAIRFACLRTCPSAAVNLFCFPYAGAGTAVYRSWPAYLPDEIAVYGASLPGREDRLGEESFTELLPLVRHATSALEPFLGRSFALFGHSMGAVIAFEIVRHLRRRSLTLPCHLFVSGFRAPHLPDSRPPLYQMAKDDLVRELRRLNGMSPELLKDPELLDLVLTPLRADLQAAQTYRHSSEAPLGCPITAYGGTTDPDVHRCDLEPWRDHTLTDFALEILPGDHFYLNGATPLLLTDLARRLLDSASTSLVKNTHCPA